MAAILKRNELDYRVALDRMKSHGAEITTSESILFEFLVNSDTEEFKEVSKIIK
jgi:hypothetical protein